MRAAFKSVLTAAFLAFVMMLVVMLAIPWVSPWDTFLVSFLLFFLLLLKGELTKEEPIIIPNPDKPPTVVTPPSKLTPKEANYLFGGLFVVFILMFYVIPYFVHQESMKNPEEKLADIEIARKTDTENARKKRQINGIGEPQLLEENGGVAPTSVLVEPPKSSTVVIPSVDARSGWVWILHQFYRTANFAKIPLIILAVLLLVYLVRAVFDPKKYLPNALTTLVVIAFIWGLGVWFAENTTAVTSPEPTIIDSRLPVTEAAPQKIVPIAEAATRPLLRRLDAKDLSYDKRWYPTGHVLKKRETISFSGFDIRNPGADPCPPSGCEEQQIGGELYAKGAKHMAILLLIGDSIYELPEGASSIVLDPKVVGYHEVFLSVNQVIKTPEPIKAREAWNNMLGGTFY